MIQCIKCAFATHESIYRGRRWRLSSSSSFRSSEGQIYITYEIGCTLQVILTAVEFLSYIDRGRPKLSSLGSQILTILQDMFGSLWSISTRT